MEYNINGKTAIVTGGSGGLGAAITEKLIKEGCNVVVADMKMNDDVSAWISASNNNNEAKIHFKSTDVSQEDQIDDLFNEALDTFGQVDIVVNNAGIWPTAYVKDMQVEAFRKTLNINVIGPFMLCKKMVNYCLEKKRKGKIVNMVSQAAFHGSTSGHAHYAASKAGMVGFTISLAREVAPFGINVNAVAPGIMESPMNEEILKDPARKEAYLERIPLKKIATVEEVARFVLFAVSSQADYMTGATMDATGGMLMR